MYGLKKKILGVEALKMNNLNAVVGEVQQQYYSIHITNPEQTVDDLKYSIANGINVYLGTGSGSFEFAKQQKAGEITKGDIFNIDQGLKGLDIAVKVADVQSYKNNKPGVDAPHEGFSMTFRTLEGHVEVGSITFTAIQYNDPETGIGSSFEFNISSTSQIDNGVATTLLNSFARNTQQEVWRTVLGQIWQKMGGVFVDAYQKVDKFKIGDIEVVNDNEGTIGYPKPDALPTSSETTRYKFRKVKVE